MRISKDNLSSTKIKLTISADTDDLAPIKHHVLSHFAKSVKVPGFRAGHAPANMIEKNVNPQALLDEFMEHAVNDLYNKAIDAEKIRPAGQPNITLKKFVPYTTLEFDAELEAIAEIKLANYKNIKLDKPKVVVSAKDVSDIIKTLQTRMAERVGTSKAAKSGDELIIDFAGFDKSGKPVNGADGKEYPLLLGSDTFIPGFEGKLVGVKGGESRDFDIKFPADYSVVGLQNKVVTFKVSVKKVSELKEPKADDEFASKVGPFKNLTELKADVKKQITIERQNEADRKFENDLVGLISDGSVIEIPDSLIEQQVLRMEEDEKNNLVSRGQTWQEHLDEEGINEKQHRERHRPDAVARVKGALVLSEIAEQEDIQVTPEELEIRMQLLKGQYKDPQMQAELEKTENRREIAGRLMNEKTLAKLVSYAIAKNT